MPLIMNAHGEFVDDYDPYRPMHLAHVDAPRSAGRYEKLCPQCFKRFRTDSPTRMYCSGTCNDAAKRERKEAREYARAHYGNGKRLTTCTVCEKEFVAHSSTSKYCSEGCRKLAANKRRRERS